MPLLIRSLAIFSLIYKPFTWWVCWVLTGRLPEVKRKDLCGWLALLAVVLVLFELTDGH